MTPRWRTGAALTVMVLSLGTSACSATVDGTAVRPDAGSPMADGALTEQDLSAVLLDGAELAGLLDSPDIEVVDEVAEMTDDSADVSDPECLGALYSAEEPVYAGSGYTAVLTRLASEPGDVYEHWVEETVVLMPSAVAAEEFVERSGREWADCAGREVAISDGEEWFDWELRDVVRDGGVVSQSSTALESAPWQCQHTVAAAANMVVEASVCAERIDDEATAVLTEMIEKASAR
ncbi:sensor domain-containing protein [Mycolicibacterium vaccae]|jgi:hypothetical protein|uniref:PknH-like extracellular domain-containing protein n=1 Tax=Mycolicibacterium vaccae ATCC 25954 TaxID=1194972 RepID=K0VP62_MYCVA|nr:sensor domain-containing protein [Mycolicibacterium vaccae]ANI40820.1 hypothetical protein MYVA_3697 [Mycolicibacterium vaccae 95051]EJZ13004.1 hypothetical protein MVAC_00620 [Mycolicibacterium vaccae ATCC 25954]MCV7062475.1 sensor domain-containing protein [Mycolicibacterium vaccae]